jgi:hypothetical protein
VKDSNNNTPALPAKTTTTAAPKTPEAASTDAQGTVRKSFLPFFTTF